MRLEYVIASRTAEYLQGLAFQQLQHMQDYCESYECRRKVLLRYFGEELAEENCGNCDNCVSMAPMEDRTIDAQKLLSCIGRTQQRFGLKYVIDVLRGAKTRKILAYNHDQLSTYGIGRDVSSDEWMRLGRALLQQGFLSEDDSGYHTVRLNYNSREILHGQREFYLVSAPDKWKKRRQETPEPAPTPTPPKKTVPPLDPVAEELFQRLRDLRKQLADERGVAPYVVFPDTALRVMAQNLPQTRAAFLSIPGVGRQKAKAYYIPFTEVIRLFAAEYGLPVIEEEEEPVEVPPPPPVIEEEETEPVEEFSSFPTIEDEVGAVEVFSLPPVVEEEAEPAEDHDSLSLPPPGPEPEPAPAPEPEPTPPPVTKTRPSRASTRLVIQDLLRQGLGIEEIAAACERAPSTIVGYIEEIVESGELLDIEYLLQPGHYDVIVEALFRVGGDLLKPVKEELGDEYSYEEIRLARASLRASRADYAESTNDTENAG